MSRIIYSCNTGIPTEGVVIPKEVIYTNKIFIDDPKNLLGFRTQLKSHTDKYTNYYEIGYFMEMLYEGLYEAFDILNKSNLDVQFSLYDFDILKNRQEELISLKLVNNLIDKSKSLFPTLEDSETLAIKSQKENSKFVLEKLGYNNINSYICLRNLLLAKSVLSDNNLQLRPTALQTLQAVIDGRFSLSAVSDGFNEYLKDCEELLEETKVPNVPDFNTMNEILLKIRNVEIKPLNIETNV